MNHVLSIGVALENNHFTLEKLIAIIMEMFYARQTIYNSEWLGLMLFTDQLQLAYNQAPGLVNVDSTTALPCSSRPHPSPCTFPSLAKLRTSCHDVRFRAPLVISPRNSPWLLAASDTRGEPCGDASTRRQCQYDLRWTLWDLASLTKSAAFVDEEAGRDFQALDAVVRSCALSEELG